MRGLLYAYSQPNSPIKAAVDENDYGIRDVLLASAKWFFENPPQDPKDPFGNFNVLATLTTAKHLGAI